MKWRWQCINKKCERYGEIVEACEPLNEAIDATCIKCNEKLEVLTIGQAWWGNRFVGNGFKPKVH